MAHKIVMLGGYRAGKSSILASILYSVTEINSSFFSVVDATDYTSREGAPVSLKEKRVEISQYIKKRSKVHGENDYFLVDMAPTQGASTYTLRTRIDGACSVDFDFVDVPGEWMEETRDGFKDLEKIVSECDVFIIAIDTPYMMQDDKDINECYNRTSEITKVLDAIGDNIHDVECEKKMIIFCPVKCEKWVRDVKNSDGTKSNDADKVLQKLKYSYRNLINKFVNNKGINMWIMPIQTVGAIEFAEMKDAYKYFTKDDKSGIRCSYDELTGIVRLADGRVRVISDVDKGEIESDPDAKRGMCEIPLAWFKKNEVPGFTPQNCEQPAYHILKFLVNKELSVTKKIKEGIDNGPLWKRILSWFRDPPFGKHIESYRKVIETLPYKTSGDGFVEVKEIID